MSRVAPAFKYKSNGLVMGLRKLRRKTVDQVTGFYSYEVYMTTNAFGERIDARGEGDDWRDDPTNTQKTG